MSAERIRAQLALARDSQLNADAPEGSLYLYALAVAYLACDEDDVDHERRLEGLFEEQADDENSDGDAILTFLALEAGGRG